MNKFLSALGTIAIAVVALVLADQLSGYINRKRDNKMLAAAAAAAAVAEGA